MLATAFLAVVVRIVPVTSEAPARPVVIEIDGQRMMRVAANTVVDAGDAKTIRVLEREWWSPVVTTSDKAETEIPLWPATELSGRLGIETGASAPRELEASFDWKGERVVVVCPVENGVAKCRLPKAMLDVRLAAKDFVPHYLWDFDLSQSRQVAIALKRGGSIAGWVAAAREGAAFDTAIVKLSPPTYGEPGDGSLLSFRTKPNKRGFFQFTGVAAGHWVIVAEAPDLSPSPAVELEVDDRNETTLRDPLLLTELAELHLSIEPEVYRNGAPWRVRLNRLDARSRFQERVAESAASETGEWSHSRLAAGDYDVEVLNARGAVYGSRRVTVVPEMEPLRIEVDRVPVHGKIRMGNEGIAAILKFSSGRGEWLSVTSKDDGEFAIDLPFEGKWRIDVRLRETKQELSAIPAVTVARKEGEPYATIDLDLPAGRIAGRVVDESGKAVKAGVILSRNGSILADILAEDGTFELVGVEPGPATIEAQAKHGSSGLLPVTLDVHAAPVTLTLRRSRRLEGFLITASGDPVAGASIRFAQPGASFGGEVVTSPTGRFVIELNANTTAVRLAIVAPGLPGKLALLRVPQDERPVEVHVGSAGGRLVVPIRDQPPPWPSLGRDGAWASLVDLVPPHFAGAGRPAWATPDGMAIDLEPGEYTLCPTHVPSAGCVTQVVAAGTTTIANTPRRPQP